MVAAPFALPGQSSRAGAVLVFGDEVHFAWPLGPRKGHFTWQVQGFGDIANFFSSAVFCGRCKNEGRRLSFAGLRFTWQGQGIRTMDATFCGETGEFIRGAAFLEFDLEDAFAWPVQHFV